MTSSTVKYPLLAEILVLKNLPVQPMYSTRGIAELFNVSSRSIQNWIAAGLLVPRILPGRWKFLTQDVESFLEASRKKAAKQDEDHEIHH
jgi:transposase